MFFIIRIYPIEKKSFYNIGSNLVARLHPFEYRKLFPSAVFPVGFRGIKDLGFLEKIVVRKKIESGGSFLNQSV